MSRKKSTPVHRPFLSYELQNIIAGGVLITLAILMFLSTNESSIIGAFMSKIGILFFGDNYRWTFSPIIMILGVMILVKKASWSVSRLVGILLYFVATSSIIGWYKQSTVGYFDIYTFMSTLM